MNSAEAIKAIKERISIVDLVSRYAKLRPSGSRLTAPCPFHQETKPSFSVNPDKGFFYCFGCQASGDIFDFYMQINGLDFNEALRALADEAGITIDRVSPASREEKKKEFDQRQQILRAMEFAKRRYQAALAGPDGEECRSYIERRGLSPEIVAKFELGWAPRDWRFITDSLAGAGFAEATALDSGLAGKSGTGRDYDRFRGRLIFPIKNLSGQTIAFGGRIIGGEDEAKYINSPDTPVYQKKDHLYGLAQARPAISANGFVFITEGYMDILTLHQFGYENSVGVLGTALTAEQIKRLSGFTSSVALVFDGDRAGRKAALRSSEMVLARGLSCKAVILPDGEDIDSLLRGRGADYFNQLTRDAPDALKFCLETLSALAPREALDWAQNFLADVGSPELASMYATRIAQYLRMSESALRQSLKLGGSGGDASRAVVELRNRRDEEILIYAVRYPHSLDDLRAIGADLALSSPRARLFWDALEAWGPDEVVYHLDEKQKKFWDAKRGPEAAPLDKREFEFDCLRRAMKNYYAAAQKASISAAITEKDSRSAFEIELDYLRALQETLEKDNEQS